MARPDFFNDNVNREFPFQEGTVGGTGTVKNIANLIDAAIADCGFIMGPESEFDESVDSIYLETIERSATDVFKFRFNIRNTNFIKMALPDPHCMITTRNTGAMHVQLKAFKPFSVSKPK